MLLLVLALVLLFWAGNRTLSDVQCQEISVAVSDSVIDENWDAHSKQHVVKILSEIFADNGLGAREDLLEALKADARQCIEILSGEGRAFSVEVYTSFSPETQLHIDGADTCVLAIKGLGPRLVSKAFYSKSTRLASVLSFPYKQAGTNQPTFIRSEMPHAGPEPTDGARFISGRLAVIIVAY